ncbi:hypothetical protein [Lichenibacterium dinghuense]|uniref:hypothetical protein n=1 Tax=Lichenibacterium dinghuense TaxID=2895977 RepID=UPI001F331DE6|nr:hypothetical protein [Lichenibacterium sp. 6Y81]
MQNVVSLLPDRPRPQRALGVPRDGARILFFTGVRYCREDADEPARLEAPDHRRAVPSGRSFDAAAHG